MWCADRLVQVRRLTCQWPDALLLLHPVWFIDARGWRIGRWRCPLGKTTSCLHPENVVRRLLVQNFVASCAPVFKAEAAREAGLLDEKLWYLADWDLWLKLARLGPTVYHPVPLASFRIHGGSQTSACHNAINDVEFQHRVVIARHLAALTCDKAAARRIARLARFSSDLNLRLCDALEDKGGVSSACSWISSGWARPGMASFCVTRGSSNALGAVCAGLVHVDANGQLGNTLGARK